MAYLKGGTVVDGNIYIEGGLRVKQIVDAQGRNLPHLEEEGSSVKDRIVKFSDGTGGLDKSYLVEVYSNNTEEIDAVVGSASVPVPLIQATSSSITINPTSSNGSARVASTLNLNGASTVNVTAGSGSVSITAGSVSFSPTVKNIYAGSQSSILKGLIIGSGSSYNISIKIDGVSYSCKEPTNGEIPDFWYYES